MNIHKKARLTPEQRKEIYQAYSNDSRRVTGLATAYHMSLPTIYKMLKRCPLRDFSVHVSTNQRFRLYGNRPQCPASHAPARHS